MLLGLASHAVGSRLEETVLSVVYAIIRKVPVQRQLVVSKLQANVFMKTNLGVGLTSAWCRMRHDNGYSMPLDDMRIISNGKLAVIYSAWHWRDVMS